MEVSLAEETSGAVWETGGVSRVLPAPPPAGPTHRGGTHGQPAQAWVPALTLPLTSKLL